MPRWSNKADPHAKREAQKYDSPVPSREFIMEHLDKRGGPADHMTLVGELGLESEDGIEAIRRRLRAMERDGQLMSNRRREYGLVSKMDLVAGRVQGHRDGFGFLIPDDASDDLFLGPRQLRSVFDGDRVLACVTGIDRRGRREGRIVEVLERKTQQVVGRYYEDNGVAFVTPESKRNTNDILVPVEHNGGARHEQFVTVEITAYPSFRAQAQGKVIEVLGEQMAAGMEVDVALRTHDIPHIWPQAVTDESDTFSIDVPDKVKNKRVDLRSLPLVTIDGEDAKDFDDAVYCEKKKSGGWRLLVAIADVSHYVEIGSALDEEALKRGNSVYFPEHVIPMLPEVLSNGLCSLKPEVDRLCMVCEMSISAQGKLTRYKFFEGVMHSHARLTYTKVGAMLASPESDEEKDQSKALKKEYKAVYPHLKELHALYKALRSARDKRGAIDFETTETKIVFGPNRKIEQIVPVQRNDAHKLIEECMLCANVAAAKFLEKHELPGLYRVHEGPKAEKLEKLRSFLGELGLSLSGGEKPKPGDYQTLVEQIQGREDFHLIQTIMLRSLRQAVYSPENQGHFGLDYQAYGHFTSPIRRYPDLLMHRAIRHIIRSRKETTHVQRVEGAGVIAKKNIYPYDEAAMVQFGEQNSMTERRADEATRDAVDWLKCEFLRDRVGETFDGVIGTVTSFGLFVELKDVYVEGLVHVTSLNNDYYHFDPVKHCLIGERAGSVYRLGDSIRVTVARVDLDDKKIDFEVADGSPKPKSKKGKRSGAGRGSRARGGQARSGDKRDDSKSSPKGKKRRPKKKAVDGIVAEKDKTNDAGGIKKKPKKSKKLKHKKRVEATAAKPAKKVAAKGKQASAKSSSSGASSSKSPANKSGVRKRKIKE